MQITNRDQLLGALGAEREFVRDHGVRRLGVFGSFARDKASDTSDIDLLIEFWPDGRSYDNLFELGEHLENRLGRPVELVTSDGLSPHLRPHVERELLHVDLG